MIRTSLLIVSTIQNPSLAKSFVRHGLFGFTKVLCIEGDVGVESVKQYCEDHKMKCDVQPRLASIAQADMALIFVHEENPAVTKILHDVLGQRIKTYVECLASEDSEPNWTEEQEQKFMRHSSYIC